MRTIYGSIPFIGHKLHSPNVNLLFPVISVKTRNKSCTASSLTLIVILGYLSVRKDSL